MQLQPVHDRLYLSPTLTITLSFIGRDFITVFRVRSSTPNIREKVTVAVSLSLSLGLRLHLTLSPTLHLHPLILSSEPPSPYPNLNLSPNPDHEPNLNSDPNPNQGGIYPCRHHALHPLVRNHRFRRPSANPYPNS